MSLINQTVEASVRSVRAFVQQYMSRALEQARASITTYAERFTHAMIIALTTSEKGEKVHLPLHTTIAQCSSSLSRCSRCRPPEFTADASRCSTAASLEY